MLLVISSASSLLVATTSPTLGWAQDEFDDEFDDEFEEPERDGDSAEPAPSGDDEISEGDLESAADEAGVTDAGDGDADEGGDSTFWGGTNRHPHPCQSCGLTKALRSM